MKTPYDVEQAVITVCESGEKRGGAAKKTSTFTILDRQVPSAVSWPPWESCLTRCMYEEKRRGKPQVKYMLSRNYI